MAEVYSQSLAKPPLMNISMTALLGVAGMNKRCVSPLPCTPNMIWKSA